MALREQHAPVCKHNTVSLIVLGIGVCPWDGSQVGPVIGWPFPQFLIHLVERTNFGDKFYVWVVSLSFHWGSCMDTGGSNFKFHISTDYIS